MALRRGARGWALAVPVMLLALYAVQPSAAFDYANVGARSVSADVVADGSAYNALSGGACTVPSDGGTCAITMTNKATSAQTFTAIKTEDASSAVTSYAFTGGSSVSSGAATTPSEVSVGSSTTLTATIAGCVCGARHIYWTFEGSKAGVLHSQEVRYHMTIS